MNKDTNVDTAFAGGFFTTFENGECVFYDADGVCHSVTPDTVAAVVASGTPRDVVALHEDVQGRTDAVAQVVGPHVARYAGAVDAADADASTPYGTVVARSDGFYTVCPADAPGAVVVASHDDSGACDGTQVSRCYGVPCTP
ncbi:hypothetical protein Deipr_2292 (plasmid) [Deinococcus proteolyticus MRP]|uniref:Uncharacterized protein n=1 Tax=Deinococcus proteolyticus (strain ATCC 35074 / DSM 20540 / JCM 6276 / NBRC 101906 / NCIMB 13154 / VKM Ac-1939 / CCM 2703 / MRP) TaxID=693977 RepID=F0RQ58_DEIPM|nr:hypothetical protein [Deinococcus proteolyticus]ADY27417.1 hypothetical protein Deipr_2292 [Deinococcus proteolyticus MRP]